MLKYMKENPLVYFISILLLNFMLGMFVDYSVSDVFIISFCIAYFGREALKEEIKND